jgi:TetR/AcrR family fatty acid metabolism transcriptional regulator
METDAYRVVQQFYGKITEIVELGQKTGEIKTDVSPYVVRALIIGAIEHIAVRWLLKDCSYDLLEQLEQIYDLIEDAIKVKPASVSDQLRSLFSLNGGAAEAANQQAGDGEQHPVKTRGERP